MKRLWAWLMRWLREPPPAGSAGMESVEDAEARRRYLQGNRSYDRAEFDTALESWREAAGIWADIARGGRAAARRLLNLRAALALLATIAMVYLAIYTLLPRHPFEMLMLSANGMEERSWWERFLDTGRQHPGGEGHKMGVREWWERFKRNLSGEGGNQVARRFEGRPTIDKRWENLLRRYGRWGPYFSFQLDYNVISGYGLSRLREYAEAVKVFEQGVRDTTDPVKLADLYQGLANAHYYHGYRLQPDGLAKYDLELVRRAKDAYLESAKLQPRPISLGNLGWMFYLLGEYPESERHSRRALEMDRGLDYVRLNLGLLHLVQGQINEAFDAYREVIGRHPPKDVYLGGINDLRELIRDKGAKAPFAHMMVGVLAMQSGDYSLANTSLTRFLSTPNVAERWRAMARRLLAGIPAEEAL